MFVRAVWADVEPDKVDELASIVGQAAATLSQQAGYQGTALLADRQTGAGSLVTYWETLADMQGSDRAAAQARVDAQARIPSLRIRDIERFEMVVQERTGPPQANVLIRVSDAHVPPDKIDDMVRFVREQAVPVLKAQPGFRAALTSVNRTTGRAISASVWDTAANLEASESAIAPVRAQATGQAGAQPATVSRFEVVLADIKLPTPV
jgi:heme-degrading monooxygenase HmoA